MGNRQNVSPAGGDSDKQQTAIGKTYPPLAGGGGKQQTAIGKTYPPLAGGRQWAMGNRQNVSPAGGGGA